MIYWDVSSGTEDVDSARTFENQLVFLSIWVNFDIYLREAEFDKYHKPGVPQGHVASPPESMHAGVVKSLSNQNFRAAEIEVRRDGSPVQFAAFLKPPCHAEANVSEKN
jgi:hypothetical protein